MFCGCTYIEGQRNHAHTQKKEVKPTGNSSLGHVCELSPQTIKDTSSWNTTDGPQASMCNRVATWTTTFFGQLGQLKLFAQVGLDATVENSLLARRPPNPM